jgi:hypothetical protein
VAVAGGAKSCLEADARRAHLLVVMPDSVNRRRTTVEILHVLHNMPLPKDVLVTTPHEVATRGQLPSTVLHTALHEGKVLYAR